MTEVLARLPGVGVLARGPIGAQTGLTLRGVSQNYIKVLVEGIDVGDPSGPQVAYDFGRLSSLDFGRAEVLRGSQSAVHGGQAVAGVISLSAPRLAQQGTQHQLTAEAGSMGTAAAAWTFGHKSADTDLGFTLSHIRTDGFSAADEADGNTEADGYEATRLSMHAERTFDSGLTLGMAAFAENTTGDYEETGFDPVTFASFPTDGVTLDEVSRAQSRGARVFAGFSTGRFEHELALSWFRIDRSLVGSSAFGASVQDYTGERRALSWKAATDLGRGRLVIGADRTLENYEQASDFGFGPSTNAASSGVTGAFAEYAFSPLAGVDLVASVRHDRHSAFGGHTTGRLAATWAAADDLTFRASAGTGFRAPSGYELYGPYGDPTLEPEDSISVDLGVEKRLAGGTNLRATLFRIETDNLIDYAYPSYLQVPGKTSRQGLEAEAEGRISDRIGYSVAYTYTDASNPPLSAGSTWNASFGRHQLALGLDAEITDKLTGSLTLRHVASRQNQADYTVLNAALGYAVNDSTEVYLRIENLTNEQYQLWPGYGTSDRAVYAGLRATF